MAEASELHEENQRLRQQLLELQRQREQERQQLEARIGNERQQVSTFAETAQQRSQELESLKTNMIRLTKQLDEEVQRRDQVTSEQQNLERRMQELAGGGQAIAQVRARGRPEEDDHARDRAAHTSMKLMRVVHQWMTHRDLQQALLRGASINDQAFSTLVQALNDCTSLQTLDLSQNLLTMDSCSDLCQLITTAPNLSFLSLADNLLSLRSVGYFMTAVMERQNTKKLMPLDLLDLQGNEGLVAAAAASAPEGLLRMVRQSIGNVKLPPTGIELVAQVMRALWRFLHDTGHPQVRDSSADEISFQIMDKITLRKMEQALTKIMLLGAEHGQESTQRPVNANLALTGQLDSEPMLVGFEASPSHGGQAGSPPRGYPAAARGQTHGAAGSAMAQDLAEVTHGGRGSVARQQPHRETRDPFADLKAAFEPPKEKLKTFNLKQIVTRNGTVLMNMLERLLETTEIDAHDVETEQTLLEYACNTGNMGLAKLCYRRGAKLSARTRRDGDTAFNIATKKRAYDMMEFLHLYGVKVNSCDKNGVTALHCAAKNNDLDGICRLVEWGADVNIKDNERRTPIHVAAAAGNTPATMLLLEVGADMNAKDSKLYTAAAHANMNSHFDLFDRLNGLGGRRHGQVETGAAAAGTQPKKIGELIVSAGILKSSSLGRIGKISVSGLPGPIQPQFASTKKA